MSLWEHQKPEELACLGPCTDPGSGQVPIHASKGATRMSTTLACVTQGLQAGHQPPAPRTPQCTPPAAVVRQGKRRGSLRPGAPLEKKGWEEGLWRQDLQMVPGPQNSSWGPSVLEEEPAQGAACLPPPGSFSEESGAVVMIPACVPFLGHSHTPPPRPHRPKRAPRSRV